MRRAALSISSNLAEGCGRRSDTELRRFIRISQGSLSELECQVLLARDLAFLDSNAAETLLDEVHGLRGMLGHLHGALGARGKRSTARLSTSDQTLDS